MNRRILYIVAILLVLGAGAIALIQSQKGSGEENAQAGAAESPDSTVSGTSVADPASAEKKAAAPSARPNRYPELTDRYGPARTGFSRQVAGSVVSLLEEALSMGEMMQEAGRQGNWGGGGRWMSRAVSQRTGVELNDEQQEAMLELYRDYRQREMDQAKVAVNALKKDPVPLMELLLAGDALKREEMSESEYEAVVTAAAADLEGVYNPLDRDNFRGGNPMADETFRTGFEGLLDDEQLASYEAHQAESDGDGDGTAEESGSNITELPTMKLEEVDQAVGSARQIASGLRQMMEGMGGLQQLQPQLEGGDGGE